MRYVHWRLYGERGLAGAEAAVWALGETVTVEYRTDALAQYQVTFEPDGRHIRTVADARLFARHHPSPQPFLPQPAELAWQTTLRVPRSLRKPGRARAASGQLALFVDTDAAVEERRTPDG